MHTRKSTHTHLPSVMGCSKSKEQKESPSKVARKEAWEAMLTKGLGLSKLDSNIKRLDTGYIASVFSANYNTALRRAPHRTKIDIDDLLLPQLLPCTEGTAPKKISKYKLGHGHARRSSLSDMTFIQPLLSNDNKEASTGQNVGGGAEADVEAINLWELMKDLDEQGVSPKMGSPSKMHPEAASLMDPLIKSSPAKAPHSVCVLKRAVTLPRAKYLTFYENTEDDDALVVASKRSVSALEEKVCLVRDHANEEMEPNLQTFFSTTHHDGGVPGESGGVNTYRHICDKSNAEPVTLWEAALDAGINRWSQPSSENPRNLQKALSMKYILNDHSIENEESRPAPDNYAFSQLSMLHGRLHNEDDDEVSLSYESDSSSCSSSPEFSSAASLKDWLPSEDPPLMLAADFYQAGKETSIFDTFEASCTPLGPDLLPSTKRVLLKYVGGDFRHPLDDATQDILQSRAQEEKVGVATLVMGTLERATKQLPKEESWAAKGNPQELYSLGELWKDLTL